MGRENTTSHDWNYTLPNLLEYLDGLLDAGSAPQHTLLPSPTKDAETPATTLWGSVVSSTPAPTTTTPPPINKPMFVMNFTLRTTVNTLFHAHANLSRLDPPEGVLGMSTGLGVGVGTASPSTASSGASPAPPDLLVANESLVTLDDTFWLGVNDSNYTGLYGNDTSDDELGHTVGMVVTSVILGIMILTTVIGNVFVIAAILLQRNLQQVANFLIVSLAVADLMVACLVMPLGAVYEISKDWILGPELCDMWTSSDVLCCTASILHLVAIALDRYWAVTQIDYIHSRNGTRIGTMILMVWLTALVVSLAPLFGWKDPDFLVRVNEHKKCLVSQDLAYQIFATMATFYVPLTAILILYWKIFQAARKRIHKRPGDNKDKVKKIKLKKPKGGRGADKPNGVTEPQTHQTTAFTGGGSTAGGSGSPDKMSNNGAVSVSSHVSEVSRLEMLPHQAPKKTKKETLEAKREKKAAKTLAIITGAFVVCWLPFFVTALLMSICPGCYFSDLMFSIFLWLGYFNSTLNPIIYTIFSPEFREAFKRIIFGRKNQRYRPGKMR